MPESGTTPAPPRETTTWTNPEVQKAWVMMNACCDEGDSDAYRWAFKKWADLAIATRILQRIGTNNV